VSSIFCAEILTLFPEMIEGYLSQSILGKARGRHLIEVRGIDIREFARGRHRQTDDLPYGGGGGMVMKVDPIAAAIEDARTRLPEGRVFLMSPRGTILTQAKVRELARYQGGLILVCGRYEGVDERVTSYVDEELSVGDFVVTGGELAALIVVDAVARLSAGVLGNECSPSKESFEGGTLEYPHYTRPAEFRGQRVPAVLQSGDHDRISRWRRWQELHLTRERRPDLFASLVLSDSDRKLLELAEEEL
jgi:tRNA (guanine37-N1)-methyltransferase